MSAQPIKSCPFCGVEIDEYNNPCCWSKEELERTGWAQEWWVDCDECWARGPSAESADVAVKLWNERLI